MEEALVCDVEDRAASRYIRAVPSEPPAATGIGEDATLVRALRAGDESVFELLVRDLGPSMLRVARFHVSSRAVAEEVVQEAWLGVLRGLDRFEGRSSLKTWIFRILTNAAKTRGEREGRIVPFSSLAQEGVEGDDRAVDGDRFTQQGRWTGHWSAPPAEWGQLPETFLLTEEARDVIERAIAALPAAQSLVIRLRDVEGFDAGEVCSALEITAANQRVLLHRARSRVRRVLEDYMEDIVE